MPLRGRIMAFRTERGVEIIAIHVPTGRVIPARGETPGVDIHSESRPERAHHVGKTSSVHPCHNPTGVPAHEASLQDAQFMGSVFPGVSPRAGMKCPVGTNRFLSIRNRMIPGVLPEMSGSANRSANTGPKRGNRNSNRSERMRYGRVWREKFARRNVDHSLHYLGLLGITSQRDDSSQPGVKPRVQIFIPSRALKGRIMLGKRRQCYPCHNPTVRDTKSYCCVLLDDNNRKPICRLRFNHSQKYLELFDGEKNEEKHPMGAPVDIFSFEEHLIATLAIYDNKKSKLGSNSYNIRHLRRNSEGIFGQLANDVHSLTSNV